MMTEKENKDSVLTDLLHAAREDSPQPSEQLFARVLADATTAQAQMAKPARVAPRRHWVQEWARALGGWPSMASLATATVAGLGLGIFPPGDLSDMTSVLLGLNEVGYLMDMSPDLAFDLAEETL